MAFDPYRVNPKREFFEIDPKQAIAIMSYHNEGDATEEVEEEINLDLTQGEKQSTLSFKTKRPKLNYTQLGISPGENLTYTKDSSISVTVVGANKVNYQGEECSLTAATKKIMGLPEDSALQPTKYWMYGEENLMAIYNKVFPISD